MVKDILNNTWGSVHPPVGEGGTNKDWVWDSSINSNFQTGWIFWCEAITSALWEIKIKLFCCVPKKSRRSNVGVIHWIDWGGAGGSERPGDIVMLLLNQNVGLFVWRIRGVVYVFICILCWPIHVQNILQITTSIPHQWCVYNLVNTPLNLKHVTLETWKVAHYSLDLLTASS